MILQVKQFFPASWFSPIGALKKRTQIESRGLPDLRNGRFITLTLDRSRFASPELGYEAGNTKLRKMAHKLRKAWGHFDYGAKMEFHPECPDWVHWHLVVPIYEKIDLDLLRSAWGLGRVNCKRIRQSDLDYVFKYAAKGLDDLPQWAANRQRLRFWSTSQNFYLNPASCRKPTKAVPPALTEKREVVCSTLGERLIKSRGAGLLVLDTGAGQPVRWKVQFSSWLAVLTTVAQNLAMRRVGCHVAEHTITATNRKDTLWLLMKTLTRDQLQTLPPSCKAILSKSRGSFSSRPTLSPENPKLEMITTWLKPLSSAGASLSW